MEQPIAVHISPQSGQSSRMRRQGGPGCSRNLILLPGKLRNFYLPDVPTGFWHFGPTLGVVKVNERSSKKWWNFFITQTHLVRWGGRFKNAIFLAKFIAKFFYFCNETKIHYFVNNAYTKSTTKPCVKTVFQCIF